MPTVVDQKVVVEHIGLARAVAWSFHLTNKAIDLEDLQEEALLGLVQAWHAYDATRGAGFGTFAKIAVRNHLIGFCKKQSRKRLLFVELDEADCVAEESVESVEWEVGEILSTLTVEEKHLLRLVLKQLEQKEIARLMTDKFQARWTQCRVSTSIQRLHLKFSEFLVP